MHQASPVALLAVGLSAALGASLGLREGVVRYRAALLIGCAGMLGAPVGVMLAAQLPQAPLMLAFAAFMLTTAWRMLAAKGAATLSGPVPPCERPEGARQLRWTQACARAMAGTGALAGGLSGLLGVGGGFVIVPALVRHSNLDLRSIQATSLAVIALVALSGLGAAIWQGQVSAQTSLPFAVGAIAGLLMGRRIGSHLAPKHLRLGFAALTIGVACLMIVRASLAGF